MNVNLLEEQYGLDPSLQYGQVRIRRSFAVLFLR
jgi:hypothetical protein